MEAHELEAADQANCEGLWLDLVAAFSDVEPQGKADRDLAAKVATAPIPSPLPMVAPKRGLFSRIFNRKA